MSQTQVKANSSTLLALWFESQRKKIIRMEDNTINLNPQQFLPSPSHEHHVCNLDEEFPGSLSLRQNFTSEDLSSISPGGTEASMQTLSEKEFNYLPIKKRPVNHSVTPSNTFESDDEEESSLTRTDCTNANGMHPNETLPVMSLGQALEEAGRLPLKKRPYRQEHIDASTGQMMVEYPEYQVSIKKR